jgi:hypothetical protein
MGAGLDQLTVEGAPGGRLKLRTHYKASHTFNFDNDAAGSASPAHWEVINGGYPRPTSGGCSEEHDYHDPDEGNTIRVFEFADNKQRHVMKLYASPTATKWYNPVLGHSWWIYYATDSPYQAEPWWHSPPDYPDAYMGCLCPQHKVDQLGFEFKVRFTDVTKPWSFETNSVEQYGGETYYGCYGIFLCPDDHQLYVQNFDERHGYVHTSDDAEGIYLNTFLSWWYDPGTYSKGKGDVGYEYRYLPTQAVEANKWYHVSYYFGSNVRTVVSNYNPGWTWQAIDVWVEITNVTDGTPMVKYGPFWTYYPVSYRAMTTCFRLQPSKYLDGIGYIYFRPNTAYIDDVAWFWDPSYEKGDNLLPLAEEGVWTSEEIVFDKLKIVRDVVISAELSGGSIKSEARIKLEGGDYSDWFEFEWSVKEDLWLYCTAIQIRLTLTGSLEDDYSPFVDELTVRYLNVIDANIYRAGLIGKMRDTLIDGYKGTGDMKRWSLVEMQAPEEMRRVLQDLLMQRFVNGATLFGATGKAHMSGLDMWGKDLDVLRSGKTDEEFRPIIAGEMVYKLGTPAAFVQWVKDMAGIGKGWGYKWNGYPHNGNAYKYPWHSSVDGELTFVEWWKTGWILGGPFDNYLTDTPEESGLLLGELSIDVYEYMIRLRGFEAEPNYPTYLYDLDSEYGSTFIYAGSPFITSLYLYCVVGDVGGKPCTNQFRVEFSSYSGGSPMFFWYYPTFEVEQGDEIKNFGDTLATDYKAQRVRGMRYYDGSTWHNLTQYFGGSAPSSGQFKYNATTRAITLATPVVSAGHNWQASDQLDPIYQAFGIKTTGWQTIPIERTVTPGALYYVGVDDLPAGARSATGGITFSVSETGYLCCWHEELKCSRDDLALLLDKYRTICTLYLITYYGES